MTETANPVDAATLQAPAKFIARPYVQNDFSRPNFIPDTLRRRQSGLAVHWWRNRPALPRTSTSRRAALIAKRGIDIVGAAFGLLVLAPLLLSIAFSIRLTDKGPVFFRQQRLGRDGNSFELLKFRSLHAERCDAAGIAEVTANVNRVTRIGSFIRRTGIDELPQLVNVLRGDMSLIGPRPHVPDMRAAGMDYATLAPHYAFRHTMRPGLTGWAQCHGLHGPTTDQIKALRRIGHDFAYVQNFSLLLDAKIAWKTVTAELPRLGTL